MDKNLRIVFMGTPEFAVASLKVLVENEYHIVGVITAPDKPSGRGLQVSQSAVKEYALSKGLRILQPEKLKNEDFLKELKELNADLQIVVAFRMLPEVVWAMPPKGTFNLHASLLPQYRGAAPINWAIINGEKETGVTTFFLQHEIDAGDVIFQETEPILDTDTVGTLYDRLMQKGASLVLKTVQKLAHTEVKGKVQQFRPEELKHAPKLFKEHCQINWSATALRVHNLVRGLSPYPAAFCLLNGKTCKITSTLPEESIHSDTVAGTFVTDNKTFLKIHCADAYLFIKELQMEGKKKMAIADFLRGNTITEIA